MWSAAASLARRLRSGSRLGVGPAPPASPGGRGAVGISEEKMGRAPPRLGPPWRRAPRRTAATRGWAPGGGTPAKSLNASSAQQAAFTAAPPPDRARSARNSANSTGSAGSHAAPRPSAKPAQARAGPAYRFHVRGARPMARASATAGGNAPAPCCARPAASASRSCAPDERHFCRRGRPARRRVIASRRSSLLRSSVREGWRPAIEAQRYHHPVGHQAVCRDVEMG